MKKLIVTSAAVLALVFTGFAQNMNDVGYSLRPTYKRPIRKEILEKAQSLNDIIPDYPVNWINSYVSVEVLVNGHGKTLKGLGSNALLNPEQKQVLCKAGLADDVEINVNYNTHNTVTRAPERGGMHTVFTVVPEVEAEFEGGNLGLNSYLRLHGLQKISKLMPVGFNLSIWFTVNEQGNIENARLSKSSGNKKMDKLLLDVINQMPKWEPAKNAQGVPVKQEFEFTLGNMAGDGC